MIREEGYHDVTIGRRRQSLRTKLQCGSSLSSLVGRDSSSSSLYKSINHGLKRSNSKVIKKFKKKHIFVLVFFPSSIVYNSFSHLVHLNHSVLIYIFEKKEEKERKKGKKKNIFDQIFFIFPGHLPRRIDLKLLFPLLFSIHLACIQF